MNVEPSSQATLHVPAALHDVLGEHTRRLDIALILLSAVVVTALFVTQTDLGGLAWWRSALAVALVADIAAGAVANLTQGTNDYYIERPAHRWGFIAIHVHVLVLAWVLGAPMGQAVALWAFTIVSACVVNVLVGHPSQASVAGLLVLLGTAGALMWQPSATPAVLFAYLLFSFKVVFSFAVDHHAARAATDRDGVHDLSSRDHAAFIDIVTASFRDDPLFVHLFPEGPASSARERRAFVSFLLDINRVFGGTPQGLFVNGRMVAAWLLEPPLPRWKHGIASLLAVVRGIPTLISLGASRMQWLNAYAERTRRALPAGDYHYLVMLGVHPDRQGRGHGGAALRAIAATVEARGDSQGIGLDTENEANVALYERFGYTSLGPQSLDGGVVAHCMLRRTR